MQKIKIINSGCINLGITYQSQGKIKYSLHLLKTAKSTAVRQVDFKMQSTVRVFFSPPRLCTHCPVGTFQPDFAYCCFYQNSLYALY